MTDYHDTDLAPLEAELKARGVDYFIEHTGGGNWCIFVGPPRKVSTDYNEDGQAYDCVVGPIYSFERHEDGRLKFVYTVNDTYLGNDDQGETSPYTITDKDTPAQIVDKILEYKIPANVRVE